MKRLAVEHADPARVPHARELRQTYPPVEGVLTTGVPELVSAIEAEDLESLDDPQRELVRELGLRSYICVPLLARDHVLGTITPAQAESAASTGSPSSSWPANLHPGPRSRSTTPTSTRRPSVARRQRACSPRSATPSSSLTGRGSSGSGTPPPRRLPGLSAEAVVGRRVDQVIRGLGTARAAPIPVASGPGEHVRAETAPLEIGGRELWISGSGVGFDDGTIYAFRDLTEERALEALEGRLRGDRLPRATHAARGDLRRGADAQAVVTSSSTRPSAIQLLGVIATESDRLGAIVNDLLVAETA